MKKKEDVSNTMVAVLLVIVIVATIAGTWLVLDSKLPSVPKSRSATGNMKLLVQGDGALPVLKDSGEGGIAIDVH